MTRPFACALIAIVLATAAHAASDRATLLVAECVKTEGVCSGQNLIRYRFANGALESREILFTSKTTDVRFDLGENHIYRNRYVITNWGDVIDVRSGELLHKGVGQYAGMDGDRVIANVNRVDAEGVFSFDLNTREYTRLDAPGKWALPGALSPDQTRSVSVDYTSNVLLHDLTGSKRSLGSDFAMEGDPSSSSMAGVPLLWLDNERILTQRHNGQLVVLRLDGSVTPLVKIRVARHVRGDPGLYRDAEGRVIYECGAGQYAIDVEHKRYTPYRWLALGNGFEAESTQHAAYGYIVRHQAKPIGKVWGIVYGAPTKAGWIAIEYGEVGSNLGYPKGVKVWSRASGTWITVDEGWLAAVIGWLEE